MANGDSGTTRRDGAAATRRDGAATTRRDAAGSTARDNGRGGSTTRDSTVSGREYGIVLPDHLAREYNVVDDLSTGGEATVAVVQHRDTGHIKVVKIYRQGITLPQTLIEKLKNADERHVLRVDRSVYTGWATPRFVEVMDYVPDGSLAELLAQSRGGLPHVAREILVEMTDALDYIHDSLKMVHRDIKPANVLIRQRDPLDLVLADLGIASELDEIARSRRETTGSVKGTPAYQSPETLNSSDAGRARDWWALGMTMCELLTGQHPFKDSAGNELRDEGRIRQAITMGELDLSSITDERWNLLCRGLLSHHPDDRWGARQVRAWLAGQSPAVVSRRGPTPSARAVAGFAFAGRSFTDPVALASHMVTEWDKATELFTDSSECAALRTWIREDVQDTAIATNLLSPAGSSAGLVDARIIAFTTHYRGPGEVILRGTRVTSGDLALRYLNAGDGWKNDAFLKLLHPKVIDALVESQYDPTVGQSGQSAEYRALAQFSRYAADTDREVTAAASAIQGAASEYVYGTDIGVDVRSGLAGRVPRAQAAARAALLSPVCLNDFRRELAMIDRTQPAWFAELCRQAGSTGSEAAPDAIARLALAIGIADLATLYEQSRASAEAAERQRQADAAASVAAARRLRQMRLVCGALTGVAVGIAIMMILNLEDRPGFTLAEGLGVSGGWTLIIFLVSIGIGLAFAAYGTGERTDFVGTVVSGAMLGGPLTAVCGFLGVVVSELSDNDSVFEKIVVIIINGGLGAGIGGTILGGLFFGAAALVYAIIVRIGAALVAAN